MISKTDVTRNIRIRALMSLLRTILALALALALVKVQRLNFLFDRRRLDCQHLCCF